MSRLKLYYQGDPVLSQVSKEVKDIHSLPFQQFIDDLAEACVEYKGLGIASPQVGKSLRVFIRALPPYTGDISEWYLEAVINPHILYKSQETEEGWEGCLSVPKKRGLVSRPMEIEVAYTNRQGESIQSSYSEYQARIFLHECDHLDGILYPERMDPSNKLISLEEYNKILEDSKSDKV